MKKSNLKEILKKILFMDFAPAIFNIIALL
jgi:hypothetical protein